MPGSRAAQRRSIWGVAEALGLQSMRSLRAIPRSFPMYSLRRNHFILFASSLMVALCALLAPVAAHAQDKAPLFINVTSDDPWKVAMAAFFGTNFALKQGHKPVVLFVNVQATPMFNKNKSAVRADQFGRTVHEMVAEFQAAGGQVLVCPVCMKASGMIEGDLIEGAEVATVKSIDDVLFRPETKTLAW
jgi:predicted peroxiredoxin